MKTTNLLKTSKVFLITLSLVYSIVHGGNSEASERAPVGQQVNNILREVMPEIAKELNKRVYDKKTREKYLASLPEKKRIIYKQKVIDPILSSQIKVSSSNGAITTIVDGKIVKLELVDFISHKYKINGVTFTVDPYKSLEENLENISKKIDNVVFSERPRSLLE
ncbi:MAG: hypothetical protein NXH75_10695, partial [Halobacteriovoraceae bacterium]|nr:hypothetical protein [Halobacteriovoraceae bacterium]